MDDLQKLIAEAEKSVMESKTQRDSALKSILDSSAKVETTTAQETRGYDDIKNEWTDWLEQQPDDTESEQKYRKMMGYAVVGLITLALIVLGIFAIFNENNRRPMKSGVMIGEINKTTIVTPSPSPTSPDDSNKSRIILSTGTPAKTKTPEFTPEPVPEPGAVSDHADINHKENTETGDSETENTEPIDTENNTESNTE